MPIYLGPDSDDGGLPAREGPFVTPADWLVVVVAHALLVAALACCAPTTASKAIQAGVVAANVADVHSTKLALESGKGREGNPLMPDSWIAQGLIKAASTTGVIWLGTSLEVRGHRTIARVMQAAIATATAVIAARNYTLAR